MSAFAFYRLPYKHHCTLVMQNDDAPEELASVADLNGKSGFVIAPFAPSDDCPILLMRPDVVKHLSIKEPSLSETFSLEMEGVDTEKEAYAEDFKRFHEQLKKGKYQKLVLARCSHIHSQMASKLHAEDLFMRTCQLYPRLFIALISTPQSGTWLMATPEILLSGNGCEFTTMALAGTQPAPPSKTVADYPVEGVEWSKKNQEEQQYVTDYIEDIISQFTDRYTKKGPFTTMAAQLYHLRTDFLFRLEDTDYLGDVLEELFPTPAVCGIPKEESRKFILDNESIDRNYYSGFVGPLMPEGNTHLFVSLRCMNIHHNGDCHLYAGGGLLAESDLQKEWEETEAKMQTMKKVLQNS